MRCKCCSGPTMPGALRQPHLCLRPTGLCLVMLWGPNGTRNESKIWLMQSTCQNHYTSPFFPTPNYPPDLGSFLSYWVGPLILCPGTPIDTVYTCTFPRGITVFGSGVSPDILIWETIWGAGD